ncbi:MAG: type I phosphomannose isomerase catalytic subunit [Eubacteriales bacterium]
MFYPMKLEPAITEIVWGGTRLISEYGMVTDKKNAAEAWMLSCTGEGLSKVINGEYAGKTLLEIYSANKKICGFHGSKFEKFPILIKFIDALDDLSIQVHPDDEYARFIGEGDGKTEAWYILDCDEGAELVLGFKQEISEKEFLTAIERGDLADFVQKVQVKKGDFFFIEAGTLHAICKGILLAEVQQNSNTTYRVFDYNRLWDGKLRQLRVDSAIDVTKREPFVFESRPEYKAETIGNTVRTLLIDCEFFIIATLDISDSYIGKVDESSFVSLLVLDGSGHLNCAGESMPIKKGESVFIPAGCGKFTVEGNIKILETQI